MDERRLTELFAGAADAAARDAPPPRFDHGDVLAASAKARRRQQRMVGGVAVAVVALAAVGIGGITVLGSPGQQTALAERAPAGAPSNDTARDADPGSGGSGQTPEVAPFAAPAQPGVPVPVQPGAPVPAPPGAPDAPAPPGAAAAQSAPLEARKRLATSSCATPDPTLFAQLSDALPAVRGASARPLPDQAACPEGALGVEVDVTDGLRRGVLRVLRTPPGVPAPPATARAEGGRSAAAASSSTPNGGTVNITTVSTGAGPPPYAPEINQLAATLAAR